MKNNNHVFVSEINNFAKITILITCFLVFFVFSTQFVMAQEQSHPLSQITPVDTHLDMDGYSIVEVMGINVTDDIDMQGNHIRNINQLYEFFDGACTGGEVIYDIEDDGTVHCTEVDDEIEDYVYRGGDSMWGNLDMDGNLIENVGDLTGTDIVDSAQITSGAVTSDELDETDSYDLDWDNLEVEQSDVDLSDVGVADDDLDMGDHNIQINDGAADGDSKVEGRRELYAGDETEVEDDGHKELTLVFNEDHGHNPNHVNVLARVDGQITVDIDGNSKSMSGDDEIVEETWDTSGWDDGTYHVDVSIDEGTNDIIEFYYVM